MQGKKIFVGLSGGVDSAVTAALLKEAGVHVTGVFIKGWYPPGLPCTWSEDRQDAMRVAARLGIPFETLDAGAEYKESVIDYLTREYGAGRTPNPDIMCNRDVKFGAFYRYARAQGADCIATGHYARVEKLKASEYAAAEQTVPENVPPRRELPVEQHVPKLQRGLDGAKDQSYFLWAVPKEVLAHTLFPLGGYTKTQVRELAQKFDLPVASKKDSQGICFLGDVSLESFLSHEIGLTPGEAVDAEGKHVGTHRGSTLYTLGQRIALLHAEPGPWYVVRKDTEHNRVTVSHERSGLLQEETLRLSQMNWLAEPVPGKTYDAQYRYHGPRIRGTLTGQEFVPDAPHDEAIAAGQSLVIYDGEELIGGGIIDA